MGSIRKLPSGRYQAQVWVTDPVTQKRRHPKKSFDREKDAKDWIREMEASPATAQGTVADMLDRYMNRAEGFEPSTRRVNTNMAKYLAGLHDVALEDLNVARVEAHFAGLIRSGGRKGQGLAPSTAQRAYKVLRAAVKNDVRLGYLPRNVIEGVRLAPVPKSKPQAVSSEDIGKFLAELTVWPMLEAFVLLGATSGMRRQELCAITWDKVTAEWDDEAGEWVDATVLVDQAWAKDENLVQYLKPTKTHDVRVLSIDSDTYALLETMRQPSGWVFSDDGGKTAWDLDVATQRVIKTAARVGVKATIRGLRHSVATYLLSEGMSAVAVAHRLGHANPAMTLNVYAEHLPSDDREAAEKMARRLKRDAE